MREKEDEVSSMTNGTVKGINHNMLLPLVVCICI